MVERRIELDRKYRRKKKMRKLKLKLGLAAGGEERDKVLFKIHRLSPWWREPEAAPAEAKTAPAKKKAK